MNFLNDAVAIVVADEEPAQARPTSPRNEGNAVTIFVADEEPAQARATSPRNQAPPIVC
jgi:hypothetical protein